MFNIVEIYERFSGDFVPHRMGFSEVRTPFFYMDIDEHTLCVLPTDIPTSMAI